MNVENNRKSSRDLIIAVLAPESVLGSMWIYLAIIYGADDGEPYWMRNYAPDMPRPTEARYATLNIELQKRTPSRHRGNYYACGHREPRTNNPELWVERGDRENWKHLLFSYRLSWDCRKSQANLSLDLTQYYRNIEI